MALSTKEEKAIKELRWKLSQSYAVKDFKVYGSKATGTGEVDSDIDVMILLDNTSPAIESEIDDVIFEINLKYDCLISAVFFSRSELEEGPYSESPIFKKAMSEGIAE
jgi:predicted nucleotidyltransferase